MCTPSRTFKPQKASKTKPQTKPQTERRTARNIAQHVLDGLTREQLRGIAVAVGAPRGRSKHNTVANLLSAVAAGTARIKSLVTITTPPPVGQTFGEKTLLIKKIRTYKPDRTISDVPAASLRSALP